jgi:hypothetical protein
MRYACVVLYRNPISGEIAVLQREFIDRDAAIKFAEKQLMLDVPFQIVELYEL